MSYLLCLAATAFAPSSHGPPHSTPISVASAADARRIHGFAMVSMVAPNPAPTCFKNFRFDMPLMAGSLQRIDPARQQRGIMSYYLLIWQTGCRKIADAFDAW